MEKKEKSKANKDNRDLCWPRYPFSEDELKPLSEEQAKMSEKEFREWVKSQGYYV